MKHYLGEEICSCGREHRAQIEEVVIGSGVIGRIAEFVQRLGGTKPFLLADVNTFAAAGRQICDALEAALLPYGKYVFPDERLEPDEKAVGGAVMHFDASCDLIVAIGSGVINDIGKILSNLTDRKYIIVATAPSMDGYASATSSMSMDGLKVSLDSRCADVIIGDTDILAAAPLQMLKSGLGDMLAKFVSIAEWRIAHIITGEYYCERVAELIRRALSKCVAHAEGLLQRDKQAVEAVFEGLVIGGVAMAYAGVSRPASGVEHYFSHVWDMRGLEFGAPVDLHGIQCAMATLQAVKLYEELKKITPDERLAKEYVDNFSLDDWNTQLRAFLGNSSQTMISREMKEGKYNKSTHPARFAVIAGNWDEILRIIDEELPSYTQLTLLLDTIGIPKELSSMGVDRETAKLTFKATKDIRDKYVLSRLAWDLGVLDNLSEKL